MVSAGISIGELSGFLGGACLRYSGARPLTEDGRVHSRPSTLLTVQAGYRFSPGLEVALEVFNLLDAQVSDIDYFYASRLAGEPTSGIADIHTHPVEPRSVRVSVGKSF